MALVFAAGMARRPQAKDAGLMLRGSAGELQPRQINKIGPRVDASLPVSDAWWVPARATRGRAALPVLEWRMIGTGLTTFHLRKGVSSKSNDSPADGDLQRPTTCCSRSTDVEVEEILINKSPAGAYMTFGDMGMPALLKSRSDQGRRTRLHRQVHPHRPETRIHRQHGDGSPRSCSAAEYAIDALMKDGTRADRTRVQVGLRPAFAVSESS